MKNYTKIILTFVLCAAFAGCTPVEEQELPVTATVNLRFAKYLQSLDLQSAKIVYLSERKSNKDNGTGRFS